jgi:hypothetical protein
MRFRLAGDGKLIAGYSVSTRSDETISSASTDGSANAAFFPSRCSASTPRAREQAPQTWMGIRCSIVVRSVSRSGGQPTGTIAKHAFVGSSEPQALFSRMH